MSLLPKKETNVELYETCVQCCRHRHLCWGSAVVGGSSHPHCLGILLPFAWMHSRRGNLTVTVKGICSLFNSEAAWLIGEPLFLSMKSKQIGNACF